MFIFEGCKLKIIAVNNEKGGSGKTTISVSLATALSEDGAKVLLLDTDTQGTASEWAKVRGIDVPLVHAIDPSALTKTLKKIKAAEPDYVVIDTPPSRHPDDVEPAIRQADLVLVPLSMSFFDAKASLKTARIIKQNESTGCFVVSKAPPKSGLAESSRVVEFINVLSEIMEVCPAIIRQRVAYQDSARKGKSVTEWDDDKAASEIADLAKWIKEKIK